MKILRQGIPFALSLLAASMSTMALAAPTSGAYATDKQNSWVQDRVGDRIGTVNMIMCIIGSMRGDAMVNQGAYVALIDQGKCQGRGDSGKSTSTSAGASNATNYMSAVILSTQASTNDPLIIRARLTDEGQTIYAYVRATAGKSTTNPNGVFSMYFCGAPDNTSHTCGFKGALKSDGTVLTFYQEEPSGGGGGGGGGGTSTTQLRLQSDPANDAGSGTISGSEGGGYDYLFAFDANHFLRKEGSNADVCFDRSIANGHSSTWRYGTYQGDGSRLEVSNPGFPVKYENGSDKYYGFWSFWGLWLPDTALAEIALGNGVLTRRVGSADVPLTPVQKGGKLWQLTRTTGQLDDYKNVSMMYHSRDAIGTTNGSTPAPSNAQYELQWDGTHLNATAYQTCDQNGCVPHALYAPVVMDAPTLSGSPYFVRSLSVFFPSGGGNGSIDVPASGAFLGSSTVSSRTRTVVDPAHADIDLHCVSNCPKTGTNLVSGATLNVSPYKDSGVWGPSASQYAYTYHQGMLNDGSADADASGATKSGMGSQQWGLNSGSMVADADLNSVKCDSNGTPNSGGSFYCSALIDQATTIYQWETGPNAWNKFFGASGITIDPPKTLTLSAVHTSGNTGGLNNIKGASADNYNGNKVPLQFSGFGELQGIPGRCVSPETNLPVPCGQSARWVPAFDMIDGTAVADSTPTTFYVKYLERELRLGKVNCSTVSSGLTLTTASGLVLPTLAEVDKNALDEVGVEGETGAVGQPVSTKPAVIDGIVQ